MCKVKLVEATNRMTRLSANVTSFLAVNSLIPEATSETLNEESILNRA